MDVEKAKKHLMKLVKALPSGVPWVGPVIASYLSQLSSEEQREFLEDIQQINEKNFQILLKEIKAAQTIDWAQLRKLLEEIVAPHKKLPQLIAIVPTGGKAGSMYPYSLAMPKSLFIVNTKPLLCHIIDSLDEEMFPQVLIQTSEFSAAIEACLGIYGPRTRCIKIDKDVPAMLRTLKEKDELTGTFLVHYCDILTVDLDWSSIYHQYSELRRKYNIIGAFVGSTYYPLGVGIITESAAKPGLLEKIDEKPEHLIGVNANTAISLFEPSFLTYVRESDSSIYRESVERAITEGNEKFGVIKIGKWWHIHDVRAFSDKQKEYYPKEIAE